MNGDIIYEILKFLHLCPEENGGALRVRKILISAKKYGILEDRQYEKPVVFTINGIILHLRWGLEEGATIYWEMEKNRQ